MNNFLIQALNNMPKDTISNKYDRLLELLYFDGHPEKAYVVGKGAINENRESP